MRVTPQEIRSPKAFLVTTVTRLCLNHLDRAHVKKEISFDLDASRDWLATTEASPANDADLAKALDAAFSVVLKCLSPIERAVFLLREVFECDYSEVARIVEKSEDNCRQILSRARERIAGRDSRFEISLQEQESLLREFLNATASGDLDRLAKSPAGNATLVRDGDDLGAATPDPISGATSIPRFLIQKMRSFLSSEISVRRSRFREVPRLLAYKGSRLVNALALVVRAARFKQFFS